VSSDVTLSAKLNVSAAASLSSTLHVSGAVTFGSTLQISGQATFSGNVIVSGTLTVTGNTSLSGTLNVASVANFNSSISVGNTLYVCGSSTLCGGITVNGVSNFGAAVSIGSTLHVSGNTTMSGTLTVGGVANFNNFINNAEFCAYTSWVIIQHNFWTCGTFTRLGDPTGTAFTGFLNVQASISCNNTLHVCGDATFNSNFTLTGTATIYGNICSTGTLQLKNLCMFGNTAVVGIDAIVRCAHLFTDVATHFGISVLPRLQPVANDVNTQYGVYGGISPINGNFDGATLNGLYYRGGAYYITIGGHTACVQTGADLAGVDLYNGCAQFSYAYGVRTRGINIVGGTNAAKGIATYGVKVESNGVINSGGYTAQFGIAIDTLTGGSYNYQMFLSGAGTGTGIWFSTVANGPRIFASATNDLNVSINNTSIISITTSGFTIVSGTTTKSIILNGDSTATSGIRFNSNLGVHIGGATGSNSNATAYNTYISNMTVGSASNDFVMWDTVSHTLHYCAGASARIYKTDIRDFEDNWRGILDVHPKIFTKIKNGLESIGYIAEDIEELGIEKLLIRFPDGRLKGLKYEKFSLYAIEVIKEQDKRIKRLEDEVTQMASTINQMAHKIMGET
jgi:cytoskeletal protein CcmA (bactofilin family)